MKKIACIVGTIPEVIKVAPVVKELKSQTWCETILVTSGQHKDLLSQQLAVFDLTPDFSVEVMSAGQSLSSLTSKLYVELEKTLSQIRPDILLAQGDTTTVMVAASVCFYMGIKFCHLEAGLRSYNLQHPFPEEYNRKAISITTNLHLAPTTLAKDALIAEGVAPEFIAVTGNTVIDSLYYVRDRAPGCPYPVFDGNKMLLLTAHRRENHGEGLDSFFRFIREYIGKRDDLELVYPVHPNPNVSKSAYEILGGNEKIHLIPPQDYLGFVSLMKAAYIILSDSGGVQEEAPALGKPVLVLRETTERMEAVSTGVATLVGTDIGLIDRKLTELLENDAVYAAMSPGFSPYGDGLGAKRSVDAIACRLNIRERRNMSDFAWGIYV